MQNKNLYAIRYVVRRTGLTPHVIRAWEKRYGAVVPTRSPKNRRLYCEGDVRRLQLLKEITDAGHTISQVAPLDTAELLELAQRERLALSAAKKAPIERLPQQTDDDHYEACLAAVLNLDPYKLERAYDQAAISMTRSALLRKLIAPLLEEIGRLWQSGSLKIINEHMATSVTRVFLSNLLRAVKLPDLAPIMVIATPVGQWHDVGALTVALTAAEIGWHPVYYGPNLPAEEIAAGVKQSGARALAISITHLLHQHPFTDELRKLRRYVGDDVALFVGGQAAGDHVPVLQEINAKYVKNIDQFSEELNSLLLTNN